MCALNAAVQAAKWCSSTAHWLASAGGLARMHLAIGFSVLAVGGASVSVSLDVKSQSPNPPAIRHQHPPNVTGGSVSRVKTNQWRCV